jgi:U3 small nucleolar RNA-associated protein 22
MSCSIAEILYFIKRTYKETLKVFYDPYGGTTFGIIFDPTLQVPRPFRVRNEYNGIPLAQVRNI